MKRVFITICTIMVVTMLAQCTTTPQKSWQVGDIYEVNGVKGVVFSVTNDGKHGRVISLDEIAANYDDAEVWTQSLGTGWRLPNYEEIKIINRNLPEINEQLYLLNQEQIGVIRHYWFLGEPDYSHFFMYVGNSCSVNAEISKPDTVWWVSFYNDNEELMPEYTNKSNTECARAVYEF